MKRAESLDLFRRAAELDMSVRLLRSQDTFNHIDNADARRGQQQVGKVFADILEKQINKMVENGIQKWQDSLQSEDSTSDIEEGESSSKKEQQNKKITL